MDKSIIIRILLMAFIGAIIGYSTNVLAVKMLFRPLRPVKIIFKKFTIQGLIPKRQADIAKNIGETIGNELIDYDKLVDDMIKEEDKKRLNDYIKSRAKYVIEEKTYFIPSMFRNKIMELVDEILEDEINSAIESIIEETKDKMKARIDISKMVEDNLNKLDLEELEELTIRIAKKELKHIENLGFIIGFIIGLVQGVITIFI